MNKLGKIIAIVIGGLLLILFGIGVLIESGFIPDAVALPKEKIPPLYLEALREIEIIEEGEEVEYFYSAAILSIKDEGNLFTDSRVISYEVIDDELAVYEANYPDITNLKLDASDSWEYDSSITVTTSSGDSFLLYVSNMERGDLRFYKKLRETWRTHK